MIEKLTRKQKEALIHKSVLETPFIKTDAVETFDAPRGTILRLQSVSITHYLIEFTNPKRYEARVIEKRFHDTKTRDLGIKSMPTWIKFGEPLFPGHAPVGWIEILKVPLRIPHRPSAKAKR